MESLRVLVADDEAGIRHSVTRVLQRFTVELPEIEGGVRFEVDSVDSGEAALERIEAGPPDILLLDHKMGGLSGIEVLERLAEKPVDVLAVMITAFATIDTAVQATKRGAFDFIAKPFTPDELKETMRKAASHLAIQRQARRLAEERRRVRFEFIRVLGHELKAPLGAIESYLAIMKSRTAGEDLAAYDGMLDRCMLRTEGMRKLISDLLDMTRIEAGEKKREVTRVDVGEIARTSIENFNQGAAARGIRIGLEVSGPTEMAADRGELEIVLNNLLSNAVKYNRDNGTIDVRVAGEDEWLAIAVRDTGIGLSPEEAGRLFQDFVRIKNDATRHILGSGLGLSIVRKIVALYRGKVGVESEPGRGSTFTVTLQRWVDPVEAADGS